MLAVIGWLALVVICVFFVIVGAGWFILFGLFDQKGVEKFIGAVVFALALTGLYHTASISPFKVTLDTHVYQEHK